MGTVEVMSGEWKQGRVCCVVGVSKADWGCGWWIVEVYKWFPEHVHRGSLIDVRFFIWRV